MQNITDKRTKGCILPRKVTSESQRIKDRTLNAIAAKVYNVMLLNHIQPEIKKILRKIRTAFGEINSPHRF